jgi:hypothetical protein
VPPSISVRLKRAPDLDAGSSPAWRVLCRYHNCRGEFGVAIWYGEEPGWFIQLHPGFTEFQADHWRMSRHATRSERQMPRRPKRLFNHPHDGFPVARDRDGQLVVKEDPRHFEPIEHEDVTWKDEQGRIGSTLHPVAMLPGLPLTIICPRCHAPSRASAEQLVSTGGLPAVDLIAS